MPRKIKMKISNRIIAPYISSIVSNAGDIPKKSKAISVFFCYKYFIA